MNKYIRILILILLAASILFLLKWCNESPPTIGVVGGQNDSTNLEIEFAADYKSLGNQNWNRAAYQKIYDKLVLYKLEGSIDEDLAKKVENALMVNYAKSINNTVSIWLINGCVDPSLDEVYNEITNVINKNDNCKTILSNSKVTIELYRAAVSLNARVNNHISQEYIESVHQSILADIEHLSNLPSLNTCSIIKDNYSKLIEEMKNFEEFYRNYNAYNTLRASDAFSGEARLRELCDANNPNYIKYKFYQTALKKELLCN